MKSENLKFVKCGGKWLNGHHQTKTMGNLGKMLRMEMKGAILVEWAAFPNLYVNSKIKKIKYSS